MPPPAGWAGGEKEKADAAAVDAMRLMLDTVSMNGIVVIGEGEKERRQVFNGEAVGDGSGPAVDVAVDPLEGTRLTALGQPNAIAVIAVAERGTMFDPGAAFYMDKIAVGPEAAGAIDMNATPTENVRAVAKAKGLDVTEVTVVVLERERHEELIGELRQSGARVNLIRDGDVAPSIAAAQAFVGVDMLMGIGGTPEGVISAAAIKCMRGGIQGKLWPRNDEERQRLIDTGYDLERVLTTDDLVSGEDVFVAATGVTSGVFLRGVRVSGAGVETESIVMRSRSGTVRQDRRLPPFREGQTTDERRPRWRAAELHETALALVADDKGILAADESSGTIEKRFDSIEPGVDRGEPARLPRHALHDAGARGARQRRHPLRRDAAPGDGRRHAVRRVPGRQGDHSRDQGRLGAKDLAGAPGEKVTEGLDGLRERLQEYRELGARFAKWRAVITIGEGIPTAYCIQANAHALARYAALCQEQGIVPIVEPEVLMDADNDIETCYRATKRTLHKVFDELYHQRVDLPGILLKPNMVISGKGSATQATPTRSPTGRCGASARPSPRRCPGSSSSRAASPTSRRART